MLRTLSTAIEVWKHRGGFWPLLVAFQYLKNSLHGMTRGIIVEPSNRCTGNCKGCMQNPNPRDMEVDTLRRWVLARSAPPVNIHFAGKHSDPLASATLPELIKEARNLSCMISVSTIGLGFKDEYLKLPVDRWIISLPAATKDTLLALRGSNTMDEFKATVLKLNSSPNTIVELVLTIWKQSAGEIEPFNQLADELGVWRRKTVFGRYDPQGYHMGRIENVALTVQGCPYRLDKNGNLELIQDTGCPLQETLFLDSAGNLRPCPFSDHEAPREVEPSKKAWKEAESWGKLKANRKFKVCKYCF